MIYMFTLIRMGKDSKDIDKDWILCIYNINTTRDIRKRKQLYIFFTVPVKMFSTTLITKSQSKSKTDKTVLLSILFFLCSPSNDIYCHRRLNKHQTSYLLPTIYHAVTQNLLFFIFLHHVATQHPIVNYNFIMRQLKILVMAPNL